MTYPETARAYAAAEYGPAISGQHDALPMSNWAEARRDLMTPQTVAENHALHVQDCAAELREIIADVRPYSGWALNSEDAAQLADAARALLAAIGEGER